MNCLKLDSSYRPVGVITAIDAFCMVYMNRASLVEIHDNVYFNSQKESYSVPCVISLHRYVKVGSHTLKCNKKNVLWRDRNTCQYCAKVFKDSELTLDHVTPKSRGGPKTWENLVASCKTCNQKKGSKLPQEAKMFPITFPKVPPYYIFNTLSNKEAHPKWLPYLKAYHLI